MAAISGLRSIDTPKGTVEFADLGDGPPILYFHGMGAGSDLVVWVEKYLVEAGFRLIVPNRPGYYGTSLSCGPTSSDCADLIRELLDALQLPTTAVIGVSGGGYYAAAFAARHPHRTACLSLECANIHPWDDPRWMPRHSRWTLPLLRRSVLRKWLLLGFRIQLRFAKPCGYLKQSAGKRFDDVANDEQAIDFCQRLLDSMRQCLRQPAGFINDFSVLVSEAGIQCGAIACPTLIIHDELDPIAPIANAEWAMQRIANAERLDVQTAGHLIWLGGDADRVRYERLRFLREHIGRGFGTV